MSRSEEKRVGRVGQFLAFIVAREQVRIDVCRHHERRVPHSRLHALPKLNCSAWFDGSDHVGIALWGIHGERWTMRKPPADWQPMPAGYRAASEAAWQACQATFDESAHP